MCDGLGTDFEGLVKITGSTGSPITKIGHHRRPEVLKFRRKVTLIGQPAGTGPRKRGDSSNYRRNSVQDDGVKKIDNVCVRVCVRACNGVKKNANVYTSAATVSRRNEPSYSHTSGLDGRRSNKYNAKRENDGVCVAEGR